MSDLRTKRTRASIKSAFMALRAVKPLENISVKELAELANQLEKAGSHAAYEQVMAAVSDFEKGNMRLSMVLASLDVK